MNLLELSGLESGYHPRLTVLRGVSLVVPAGACVSILGSNGAGKSTLLKTVMGLLEGEPRKGSVRVLGEDVTGAPSLRVARLGVAYVVEGRGVFPELSVSENLHLGAFHRRDPAGVRADLSDMHELFPRLAERRGQLAGTLSGGEQGMLALARALMSRPKLLMLDEPSLGLAPILVEEIFDRIREVNRRGTGVLLVEQNAAQALRVADYGYVLEAGRIVLEGPSEALRQNANVRELYLGLGSSPEAPFVKRRRRWG